MEIPPTAVGGFVQAQPTYDAAVLFPNTPSGSWGIVKVWGAHATQTLAPSDWDPSSTPQSILEQEGADRV
jgi:hypothetical protein